VISYLVAELPLDLVLKELVQTVIVQKAFYLELELELELEPELPNPRCHSL
jgi:hypothetical protein